MESGSAGHTGIGEYFSTAKSVLTLCVQKLFAASSSSAIGGAKTQIASFNVIAETHTLCIITRSGDIAVLPLENDIDADAKTPQSFDLVGTLTPVTVLAVAVAPDSSLLVIIASASNLLLPSDSGSDSSSPIIHLMSPASFTVISSAPLTTTHHGAAAPINVGWGSKSTQFHGSLGKNAAQAQPAAESRCTTTPDDDAAPRVSWRGDAQFFVVSALEGLVPGKRVLRVYNRAGVLQSTAEDVPGLEHVLCWRPSGGLIASVQRFGKVPGGNPDVTEQNKEVEKEWALGKGTDGRHDVVFFERNGLRHGEFTLRESWRSAGDVRENGRSVGTTSTLLPSRRWGYRVRELGWNADSSVLSVWVERVTGDVGE
jgi:elongator complex protein 1